LGKRNYHPEAISFNFDKDISLHSLASGNGEEPKTSSPRDFQSGIPGLHVFSSGDRDPQETRSRDIADFVEELELQQVLCEHKKLYQLLVMSSR
jgi:hypothetical protein